jgi:polysaccharide export outer membrane protein
MPKIFHGDTVYVRYLEWKTAEPKEDKVLYVTGKVRGPGQFKLWDQMTVLQAIALAGGLTEWADSEHITIVRIVAGKQENIPFNYKKGISGKYPELNIYLHADDTIVVP